MTSLYLSRVTLRRDDGAIAALAPLLSPSAPAESVFAGHRLIWSLFADSPERTRDFLWRQEGPGQFMVLSARPPCESANLFEIEGPKLFTPDLREGDRLQFMLRANPTVTHSLAPDAPLKASGKKRGGQRHDVVMDALNHLPQSERAETRFAIIQTAGRAWLEKQGQQHGFTLSETMSIDGYETVRIPRRRTPARPMRFSQIEYAGTLTVRDPERFLSRLAAGFGRARAFGCGLMLIRRATSL